MKKALNIFSIIWVLLNIIIPIPYLSHVNLLGIILDKDIFFYNAFFLNLSFVVFILIFSLNSLRIRSMSTILTGLVFIAYLLFSGKIYIFFFKNLFTLVLPAIIIVIIVFFVKNRKRV
jgi:hypothetical protein